MKKIEVGKILLVLMVIFITSIISISSFSSRNLFGLKNKLNLGLDLKGGVHLLLEVDFDHYVNDQMDMLLGSLRKEFRNNKIAYKNLKLDNNNYITFSSDSNQFDAIRNAARDVSNSLRVESNEGNFKLFYDEYKLSELQNTLLERSIEIVRMRVDSSGTKEPNIQQQGTNYILLQMPGVDDPGEIRNILGKTAKLTFHLVSEEGNMLLNQGKALPVNAKLIPYQSDERKDYKIAIQKKSLLSGDMLTNANMALSEGEAIVEFSF
ncbi:MAG: protein translocase subunit SecD, partial [Rickettsiaceae bacterium]|nr:protein translocase subunit SecD [Rickettsiaceae bacterium]